jgi:hypothetical protein
VARTEKFFVLVMSMAFFARKFRAFQFHCAPGESKAPIQEDYEANERDERKVRFGKRKSSKLGACN